MSLGTMRFTERIERSNVDGPLIARKTGFPQADFSGVILPNSTRRRTSLCRERLLFLVGFILPQALIVLDRRTKLVVRASVLSSAAS